MDNVVDIYCDVDDFMQIFLPVWHKTLISQGKKQRICKSNLTPSEVITILILFHQSNYRTLKHFYLNHVCHYLCKEFTDLVSYSQFVRLQQAVLVPLCYYLRLLRGKVTGISYIDSTSITVCHNRRISRNKVFQGFAKRGKTSMGWFFGFKLHLVVNECGELLSACVTCGNTDDREPLEKLVEHIHGKLFADRGYISSEKQQKLLNKGLQLITNLRRNMHNKLLDIMDKILLRKRFIIETINDQLKNKSQIEHSRHRSITNFMVNLIAGLLAYVHQPKKPAINLTTKQRQRLQQLNLTYN